MAPTDVTRHPGGLVNPLILGLIIFQLLASASAISEDVYRGLINPDASQARLVGPSLAESQPGRYADRIQPVETRTTRSGNWNSSKGHR